jgi:hypothetical protein
VNASFFGRRAESLRDALPPGTNAVVFDESGLIDAAAEIARRRAAGERVAALPLIDDVRVRTNAERAREINRRLPGDTDARYYAMMALAQGVALFDGKQVAEEWTQAGQSLAQAVSGALAHAGELIVRSYSDYTRMLAEVPATRTLAFHRIALAATVPAFERRRPERPAIVVWTGRRDTADATLALIGLEEFRGEVSYVGDAPLPHVSGRFIARHDPALPGVLGAASCIVCVDPGDPADAAAFARGGTPVVAPLTSGAFEDTDGIVAWDAADASQLSLVVNIALSRRPAGTSPDTVALSPAVPALPAGVELPLVSILTATYNRREQLRGMLQCLAAQTYPNIESIVVNDAGEPVDDIVAEFPFARLIEAEVNGGEFFRTAQLGLAHARGAYIGMLPDDDRFYPDHIERLMAAILHSGAPIAHSFGLMRFLRPAPGGGEETWAINPLAYSNSVTPTPALVGSQVPLHQTLQRRDTFEPDDVGWPILGAAGSDQEYHMRLTQRHQWVAVDHFTCEFRDHPGNTGKVHNWADAMRYIYEVVQPATGRQWTAAFRRKALDALAAVPAGESANRPLVIFLA